MNARLELALFAAILGGCVQPRGADIGEVQEGQKICAKGTTISGVDVSHYDGTIDWAKVKGAGIDFAFMKATENVNFIDPQFAANWSGAAQHGVIRGAYHFFRPSVDAVMQADYFVQHAGVPQPGDLPLTLDLEVTEGLPGATVAQDALAFLQRVQQKTGRTPIVYTSSSFLSTLGTSAGFGGYVLWVANWQVTCPGVPSPPWSDWTFWQNADNGTVAGIPATAVDTDQFNGTLGDLQSFVNPAATSSDLAGVGPADLAGGGSTDLAGGGGSDDLAGGGGGSDDLAGGGGTDGGPVVKSDSTGGCACDVSGPARRAPFALVALLLSGVLVTRRTFRSRRPRRTGG